MKYTETYMWKEIAEAQRVTADMLNVNMDTINGVTAACERLGVKNISLAGRGTSDHALFFFKYVVEILSGYSAGYVAPSVVTMYGGKVDYSGQLVIGCSQSGYAADVIEVINTARAQGAVTLAVTNDDQSPLAKAADFHLYLNAGKEISVAATKTFTAQLYGLAILACALSKRADLIAKYAKLSERIGAYAEQADALTDKDCETVKEFKDGFTLARGITYSLAFESALKLQETCYIRMRGYSTSDFYHGPMAMVQSGTGIILYAPTFGGDDEDKKAYHLADQVKCIEKMLSFGANVTIVTDNAALSAYADRAHVSLFAPINDEIDAMFAFAIYAQMLACKVSCAIGNNPDSPKALNKVTITK